MEAILPRKKVSNRREEEAIDHRAIFFLVYPF
jgi:hypothetical protein